MLEPILFGFSLAVVSALIFGLWYVLAFMLRKLADIDVLVTYPSETTAKAIMRNGRVHRFVMSFKGKCFDGDLNPSLPEPEKWKIVDGEVSVGAKLPFIRNLRWVGIPPFSNVYTYRFSWASLEERTEGGDIGKKPVWNEKPLNYIFVRSDIYASKLESAECANNIPLDATILVGGHIVNPYKALFSIERWLEASLNVVDSRMRSFFGKKTFVELRKIEEAMRSGHGMSHELSEHFAEVMESVEDKYGFKIEFIQIYSIDPGSKLAEEYIRATTLVYVAEQQRDADVATGEGLAARDSSHFKAISEIESGLELFKWDSIRQSGLTTYVEGGGVGVTIPISGAARPKSTTGPAPAEPHEPTPA